MEIPSITRLTGIKIIDKAFSTADTGQAEKWLDIFEKLGLIKIIEEIKIIDIIDKTRVQIKRHGKIVYEDKNEQ